MMALAPPLTTPKAISDHTITVDFVMVDPFPVG
jgi:hypothetical protein